jgi:hypothetical protein
MNRHEVTALKVNSAIHITTEASTASQMRLAIDMFGLLDICPDCCGVLKNPHLTMGALETLY